MSRIDRIRRAVHVRRSQRTETDGADEAEASSSSYLPVPVGPAVSIPRGPRADLRRGDSEFAAHLMGQEGQRRGLRAGPSLLETASATYNQVEWSGSYDRRLGAGRLARKIV